VFRRIVYAFGLALCLHTTQLSAQEESSTDRDKSALDSVDPTMIFELGARNPELAAVLSPLLEEVLMAGELIDGWSSQGVSFDEVQARFEEENGSAFYLEEGETGPMIIYQGDPVPLLNENFARHRIFEGHAGKTVETSLIQFGEGIWFEAVAGVRSVDNATCSNGIESVDLLANRPISQWSDEELGTTIFLYAMFKEFADAEICLVYNQVTDDELLAKAYSADGAEFPTLNEDADVGRLVTHAELLKRLAQSN
jgi:hypothetical protein